MVEIRKATVNDATLLAEIGKKSFIESHGRSASEADINSYVNEKYTVQVFVEELSNPENNYHIIFYNEIPAGYSKIIFNVGHKNFEPTNLTKLERLYLLKEFYHLKLGYQLLNFNINLSKQNKQHGMWLFVWKENLQAVNFYLKAGFKITGSHDFKISETHSNPNHQMLLEY